MINIFFAVITRCDECWDNPDEDLEIAKFAVAEITQDFESNKWALQHIAQSKANVSIVLVYVCKRCN